MTTADGTVHGADVIVVAAGAWVGRLLPVSRYALLPYSHDSGIRRGELGPAVGLRQVEHSG